MKILHLVYNTMIKVSDSARTKIVQLMAEDGYNADNDYVRVEFEVVDAPDFRMN